MLISFEGIDFCGKDTQIALLHDYLKKYRFVKIIKETSPEQFTQGVPTMEDEELLFWTLANEWYFWRSQVFSLQSQITLLLNRGPLTTYVYNVVGFKVKNKKVFREIMDRYYKICPLKPDITFVFVCPIEEILKRREKRGAVTRWEVSDIRFLTRLQDMFVRVAKKDSKMVLVDGSKSIEEVAEVVRRTIKEKFNL